MEVHAHSHTARKKWTHYFWEFLMLFLAVFCGFLAEYQLEHKIEKDRAKQYIHSFYEDIKTDSAEFSMVISDYELSLNALKKRKVCYESIKNNPKSDECLADLFNYSNGFTDLINADQTLHQLKNAGGLRLLNHADADSILAYDKMIRKYIKEETTGLQENQNNLRSMINSLRNYDSQQNGVARLPILYSENRELLNKYFNTLDEYYMRSQQRLSQLILLKQKAIHLIEYFKNKYQLK